MKFGALILLPLVAQIALVAGPSNVEPDALLPAARDTSADLLIEADLLNRQVNEELGRYETFLNEGKYKAADIRVAGDISDTYIKIERLRRIGERLSLVAEPTGAELKLRADDLQLRCTEVIGKYRELPEAPQMVLKIGSVLPRLTASKQAALKVIGNLFKQEKVEQAQKRMDETIQDELLEVICWLPTDIGLRTMAPFSDAKKLIDTRMSADLQAKTAEELVQTRAEHDPQFAAFLTEVKTAVEAIKSNGTADWRGRTLTGPELLAAWVADWRSRMVQTQHCRAIDWARGIKQGIRPLSELDQLEQDYADFESQLIAAMGQLIAVDAARVIPDGVSTLHAKYLDAIADAAVQISHEAWRTTVEAELNKLRDKSPRLTQQVEAYAQATDDILRWRKRAADAAERGRTSALSQLAEVWAKGADPKAMAARQRIRSKPQLTYLSSGAPALVRDLSAASLMQSARVTHIAPSAHGGVSRYQQRLMARLPAYQLPVAEIDRLKSDLLVDDASPPLTLSAVIALRSAEQGYLQSAGGELTGLELQSLITHFLRLDENSQHLPLGPFAPDAPFDDRSPLLQVMYVYDLKPAWLRHEYIFSSVP